MDSLENDDQLTIVNRSTEYKISKQLIRKIPYFEKMLSHDLKESKENKVELDFDEKAFNIILNWIKSDCTFILIEMNYVINLYELADYFGLDSISKDCITYFRKNFTIEDFPIVVSKLLDTSKFINSGALNAFICRYFLMIINSYTTSSAYSKKTFWLEYPVETIEYICTLDLMIYSEYQVFDAIVRWVNFMAETRNCHLKGLLKLVRWCHLNEEDLSKIKENELFKSSGFEPIFCSPRKVNCDCIFNRTKQRYFVMIEKLDNPDLDDHADMRIKVLDNNLTQLVSQVFKHDESIPGNLIYDDHISDIHFDSRYDSIRIDWKHNKYRHVSFYSFYYELKDIIARSDEQRPSETFSMIRFDDKRLHYFPRPIYENYRGFSDLSENRCKATLLDNKIYLFSADSLNSMCTLYEYKIENNKLKQTWSHSLWDKKFRDPYVDETIFTPSPAGDKIILIHKINKNYVSFDVNTKESCMGQITSYSSADDKKSYLLTLTSAFIPLNITRT